MQEIAKVEGHDRLRRQHTRQLVMMMSQVTNLLLKSRMNRLKGNTEAEVYDAQSGFRQCKWAIEGILNL